ncbi:hypothetical protein SCUCBS95973_009066 [Sporothrix curviconia]|uniref:Uncharacterized protein n=1 Tax=Sporothrix curviconia TaxID=1260050 RepID=A0ABP0CRT5_9PEZI
MAPAKGKKRAYSNESIEDSGLEDIAQDVAGSSRPAQAKKPRRNNRSSHHNGARNQEAGPAKQYANTFQENIVAAAREKAMATLGRGEEAKMKRDKKAIDSIREAYNAASAPVGATDHPLYVAGREVLELFHATLARYEQANAALEQALRGDANGGHKTVDAVQASWKKDREEANKLLRYGRVYGDGLVHDIIMPKTAPGGPVVGRAGQFKDSNLGGALPESGLNKTGRTALGMFPKSRATVARGQTWGEAAKSQVQALKGLLKTLPGIGGHRHEESTASKSVTFDC